MSQSSSWSICPACLAPLQDDALECPACGYIFEDVLNGPAAPLAPAQPGAVLEPEACPVEQERPEDVPQESAPQTSVLVTPTLEKRPGTCLSAASVVLSVLSILGSLLAALFVLGALSSDPFSSGIDTWIAWVLLGIDGAIAFIALGCALVLQGKQANDQKGERAPLVTSGIAFGLVLVLLLANGIASNLSYPPFYDPATYAPVATAAPAATPTMALPAPDESQVDVGGIAAGPDGNVWFAVPAHNAIGQITPEGHIQLFPLPSAGSTPFGIARGPDGNLWFTERGRNALGRLTPGGTLTEFLLPVTEQQPSIIIAGPDGALWFLEQDSNRIGRMTTDGKLTGVVVITPNFTIIHDITVGPDKNFWFTLESGAIGRMTLAGQVTEFQTTYESEPFGIAAGPDGNVWFTERGLGQVGVITPQGSVTEVGINEFNPDGQAELLGIVAGPDGNVWLTVTEPGVHLDEIAAISPTDYTSQVDRLLPTFESLPDGIVQGPDGNIWFTERGQSVIGRVTPDRTLTEFPIPATA